MRLSNSRKINPASDSSVICFALPEAYGDAIAQNQYRLLKFDRYLEYAKTRPDAFCFVIGTDDIHKGCKLIKSLRADPASSIKPIYLLKTLGDPVDRMTDGVVATIREAYESAVEIVARLMELDSESLIGPENDTYRVLGYMYSRPNLSLEPHGQWQDKSFYGFPVLKAMFGDAAASSLLRNLIDRRLVAPLRLVDRLRHCGQCDGVHLNYIDICPNCAGIDIVRKPFLHCFACGHVAPEEQFIARGTLACPKCAARLRHIGVDYDRPLENYHCNGCRHVFIEPVITARCMHCQTPSAPDELIPRPVYAYQLTEKGRMSARTGAVEDMFGLIDNLNNMTVAYFQTVLEWLISLCRRHKDEQFSLVGIRIRNIVELTDRIGRSKVRELMDEFARRVHELIRSTDLATRMNQYTLWLLLPKTDVKGNQVVLDRIRALKSDDPSGLSLATISYHAPSQMIANETATLLLSRLEGMIAE